jgi:hypothetical protein
VQILEQFGKMAQLRMNYSCPRRQFILALRSRKTCCAVCGSQTTDIFSQVGLQQHYRITHKGTEFDDNSYNYIGFIYFKLLMYFTMNVCFNIGY